MRPLCPALLVCATALTVTAPAPAVAAPGGGSTSTTAPAPVMGQAPLPLGAPGLTEHRDVRQLAPGVTQTVIERGEEDAPQQWVVELAIPVGQETRPVSSRAYADAVVADLAAHGIDAEAQLVRQQGAVDVPDGPLGYRVRLTDVVDTEAQAESALAEVEATGHEGRVWNAGWDGGTATRGHWTVRVLTIDPRTFTGDLEATFGADLQRREKTSELAAGATAAVNGGYFVFDRAHGAEGDPAGVGQYDGEVLSEPVGERPSISFDADASEVSVERPRWGGTATVAGQPLLLDGVNRVPGTVRNCGGHGDRPTDLPVHDTTCTDEDELVVFTEQWGGSTPRGAGREVVLDAASGEVLAVRDGRGATPRPGQYVVQATGDRVGELAGVSVGDRLPVSTGLLGAPGMARDGAMALSGGPELVRDGRVHVTLAQDGFVHAGNPSFQYGWVLQRNPRTLAGEDSEGRLHLITIDGRQPDELGASIPEAAAVARSLGLQSAVNLDGGGSTTMVVDGKVANEPSDEEGERAVGDALVITAPEGGPIVDTGRMPADRRVELGAVGTGLMLAGAATLRVARTRREA
ncbi:phosphodiester glycosidase family protein [Kytococcus sp. Marseille-QA3725]